MRSRGATTAPQLEALLRSLVDGPRGRALRSQLASRHPERSPEEIEDAIQTACKCFLDETHGMSAPGQVYAWIRTVAHRSLHRERELLAREVPVDPAAHGLEMVAATAPSPEAQVIDREDEADLARLALTLASSLPERKRKVLALYGAGYKRPEIAGRLGMTHRTVKRDLLEIMDEARATVARLAGGGCTRGEPLIVRLVCGLATPSEAAQAELHLTRCERCEHLHVRLNLWREKVGAVLPIPVGEQTSPGTLERTLYKTIDGIASLRQHLTDGGAQLKQHASSAYVRATDLTPLAGARPGATVAVVAGCLTLGTGTYAVCVDQGLNPLGTTRETERHKPARKASVPPEPPPKTEQPPPQPPAPTPEPTPIPTASPSPQPQPQPTPTATPPPPPPEQSFEPASPDYTSSASQPSAPAREPAPVPSGGVPEFGGP